ncbi:MAG: hypothetical protein IJX52_06585 [Oscillibacter sp.]|nr:hypothetical protein [Oscillibacter sp.]
MRKRVFALAALCALLLTGCASLLERQYVTSDLHTSKFWESEAAGTLRAENRQDIVNDLLLLISQHTESATIRLYNFTDEVTVSDTVQQATTEVRHETPMGAYAVEYITYDIQAQRSYYEIDLAISYRRTAEQVKAVLNATSAEAVYNLLEAAVEAGQEELAVRIGYWDRSSWDTILSAVADLRAAREMGEEPYWAVNCYPADGVVGVVEFLLDAPAPEEPAQEEPAEETSPEEQDAQEGQ